MVVVIIRRLVVLYAIKTKYNASEIIGHMKMQNSFLKTHQYSIAQTTKNIYREVILQMSIIYMCHVQTIDMFHVQTIDMFLVQTIDMIHVYFLFDTSLEK